MSVRLTTVFGCLCLAMAFSSQAVARETHVRASAEPIIEAKATVARQIERYVASINNGDVKAAEKLWGDSRDITFINPPGIHQGWPAINGAVHTFFRDRFTKRDLRLVAAPAIQMFGNTAVAEFVWNFDGTMTDGRELHTRGGRESQVYVLTSKHGWRLVHAHYSLQPNLVPF